MREQAPYHVVDGCCSILREERKGIVTATSSLPLKESLSTQVPLQNIAKGLFS